LKLNLFYSIKYLPIIEISRIKDHNKNKDSHLYVNNFR